jgi:molybdopterin-guanine dinucleotide biosynthesis protein A
MLMAFSAVILAGGASRRMGRDKAFLEVRGKSLLAHQVETVTALRPAEILVSGRADTDYSHLGYPVVLDAQPGCGPIAGIERALALARSELVLVLAVDLPGMTSEFLGRLLALFHDGSGVVPETPRGLEPLAGVYPKCAHGIASDCLQTGRRTLADFVTRCARAGLVRIWRCPTEEEPVFANWNSPADLAGLAQTPEP